MQWYWNEAGHMAWMGLWWVLGGGVFAAFFWAILRSSGIVMNGRKESPERILKRR